jgi:hypothetical protein
VRSRFTPLMIARGLACAVAADADVTTVLTVSLTATGQKTGGLNNPGLSRVIFIACSCPMGQERVSGIIV